jgi:hypothetical protein
VTRNATLIIAAVCTLLPLAGQFGGDRAHGWLGVDFRGYYCAALAQRNGTNPYFTQPLHDCEAGTPTPFYRAPPNVTVPAPYPPYALAFFYPLTFVPFPAAMVIWWMLLAVAVLLAAQLLARIARQPFLVAWAALALAAGLSAFSAGNVFPIALAALLVAAFGVVRGRPIVAAAAVAVAMVEPHVALPAALALFFGYPAIRVPLAVAIGSLVVLSLASGGFAQNVLYLTAVLPAHALSEVSRDNQYSLSSVLAALGVSDSSAAFFGSMTYLLMTAIGTLAALRLARRYAEPAFIVLVPPAVALLGGSFAHTIEIAAAVPACMLLYLHAQACRGWLFGALVLLAVPWMMATSVALFLAPIFPVAYLTYVLWRRDRAFALGTALASFAVIFALFALAAASPAHTMAHAHAYPPIDPRLAEASWRDLVLGNTTNRPIMWLLRLPTWIGLAAFVLPAVILSGAPQRVILSDPL